MQIPTSWGEVFPPPSGISLTLLVVLGVLVLLSCFASFAELGPLLSPFFVVLVATRALTNRVPRLCFFSFCFLLIFLFFPCISIDLCATIGVFSLFFYLGCFYFVTTGWIFDISLCENSVISIYQSGLDRIQI